MKNLVLLASISFLLASCSVSTKRSDYGGGSSGAAYKRSSPSVLPPKRPVNPPGLESTHTATQTMAPVAAGPDWRNLNPDQLRSAYQDPQYAAQRTEILFRLGEQEMARRNTDMALNYFNQEGVIKETNYDRFNMRVKSDYKKGIFINVTISA